MTKLHPGWRTKSPIAATTHPHGHAHPPKLEVSGVHRGHKDEGDYKSSPTTTHLKNSAIDTPRKATSLYSRGEKRKGASGIVNRLAGNRLQRSHKQ
jgi:hypothetical protein